MTHVTCRLTTKNRDQLRNPMLGNRVWATFTFLTQLEKSTVSNDLVKRFNVVLYWSRASASRLYRVLIGCSETRTVSARLVLNTCCVMRPCRVEFANWSSLQFKCCEQALTVTPPQRPYFNPGRGKQGPIYKISYDLL